MPLVVGESDLEGLEVRLTPGVELTWTLAVDGAPPLRAGAGIVLWNADGERSGSTAPALADQLRLTGVRPGRYLIVPSVPQGYGVTSVRVNGREVLDEPVDVGPAGLSGVVVTITDRTAPLQGSVRDSDGEAAAGAFVAVFPAVPTERRSFGGRQLRMRRATAGADGRWRIADLPAGDYIAATMTEAQADHWPDAVVLQAIAQGGVRVSLVPGVVREVALRQESR
jgi:hypothetical protein